MPRRAARIRKLAVLVPLLGTFLLLPPGVLVFARSEPVGGVPLVVCYVFGVWAALVAASAWLARHLPESGGGGEPPPPG